MLALGKGQVCHALFVHFEHVVGVGVIGIIIGVDMICVAGVSVLGTHQGGCI